MWVLLLNNVAYVKVKKSGKCPIIKMNLSRSDRGKKKLINFSLVSLENLGVVVKINERSIPFITECIRFVKMAIMLADVGKILQF